MTPLASDQATWNLLLAVATALVLLFSVGSLVLARPRSQVLAPFLASLVISVVVYVSMVDGASSFHTAFVVCVLLALNIALALVWSQPKRDRLATFSWSLLGVVTPYLVLFGFLAVACWGKTECLG